MNDGDAMTFTVSGIKCDNEECDYKDDTVHRKNYSDYVNKPCPDCGSNLLTQADYDSVVKLEGMVLDINMAVSESMLGGEEKLFEVKMDGTGSVNIVEKEG